MSKNADARFFEDSCLADVTEQKQEQEARQGETSEDDGGTTQFDGDSETTFGGAW